MKVVKVFPVPVEVPVPRTQTWQIRWEFSRSHAMVIRSRQEDKGVSLEALRLCQLCTDTAETCHISWLITVCNCDVNATRFFVSSFNSNYCYCFFPSYLYITDRDTIFESGSTVVTESGPGESERLLQEPSARRAAGGTGTRSPVGSRCLTAGPCDGWALCRRRECENADSWFMRVILVAKVICQC